MNRQWLMMALCGVVWMLGACAMRPHLDPLQSSLYADMIHVQDSSSARESTWNREGFNVDARAIQPGESLELANIEGAGCIRHIYFTGFTIINGSLRCLRDNVLRAYWDGETSPSVEVPIGDFFGVGQERWRIFTSQMVTINPGAGRFSGMPGLNNYFPMPFRKGARLTLTNEGTVTMWPVWFHIDYEKLPELASDVGYFHAQWRRTNPTKALGPRPNDPYYNDDVNLTGKDNYVVLEAEGKGNLAGYFINVDNFNGNWYGEGDDMIFIDGETWPPSLHGTGSEEIIGGGACPTTEYAGPYTGYHLIANPELTGKTSMYRWFVPDPIRFQKSIRVTMEHGSGNNYETDYSSTAFWYQIEPHAPFPRLLPPEERRPRWGNDPADRAWAAYLNYRVKLGELEGMMRSPPPPVSQEAFGRFAILNGEGGDLLEQKKYDEVLRRCDEAIATMAQHIPAWKTKQ
jgi:hypothetical protein